MTPERVCALLALCVPIRIALDWLWPLPGVGPISVSAAITGGMTLGFGGLVALRWRTVATHPLRVPLALFAGALVVGLLRADRLDSGVAYALHLGAPGVWLLALHAWWTPGRPQPAHWIGIGVVPVIAGLALWVAGQPSDHVVNGWPRLLGLYSDMHPHAVVMAMLVVGAGGSALAEAEPWRRAGWSALAVGASLCLLATWVRTPLLMAAVGTLAWLAARGHYRALGVFAASALAAVVTVPALRRRFSDVVSVLSGAPPEGGWGAIGSWRGRIWADSAQTWWEGGVVDVLVGRGLGEHVGLHRHLDPHSEWLSLLAQVGVIGFVAWQVWMGAALVTLWRRRTSPEASLAFAWLLSAWLTAALSNDWIVRTSAVWLAWGAAGIALHRPVPAISRGRPSCQAGRSGAPSGASPRPPPA